MWTLNVPFSDVAVWVAWNLFLAVIPVLLGYGLERLARSDIAEGKKTPGWLYAPWAAIWLAFLPNTCYLVTEWRHFLAYGDYNSLFILARQSDPNALLMVAELGVFFLIYSGIGLALFAAAIRPVERLLNDLQWEPAYWKAPLFSLMSLGVYLGLILRFNSWDLLTKPLDVGRAAYAIRERPALFASLLIFAGFLWLCYEALKVFFEGLEARRRPTTGIPQGVRKSNLES